MEERISNYTLEKSRNGLTIPVVNEIYLHSIYNPVKEAEVFADSYRGIFEKKSTVLILGLGFGYHVEEIAKILNSIHKEYRILILEPNKELIAEFNEKRQFEDQNIQIVYLNTAEELYSSKDYINFLMTKPAVIKHEASYSLYKEEFANVLSYRAETNISKYSHLLSSEAQKFVDTTTDGNISDRTTQIFSARQPLNRNDYFLLAFNEIARSQGTRNE